LEALTDSLRGELEPWGLSVAIVEPGAVSTPIWAKSTTAAETLFAAYPASARVAYGRVMAALRQRALRSQSSGAPPDRVVQAVLHALTARRPHTRYLVGWDARLAALAARLPDRLRDRLLATRLPRYGR
jgi:short-subunit dehydrogenase